MKELKCKECGATINIDEDKQFGTCPYCGQKYKLNEDLNVNINLGEDLNNVIKQIPSFQKVGKIFIIIFIIIFLLTIVPIITSRININKKHNDIDNKTNEIKNEINNKTNEIKNKINDQKIEIFNSDYNMYSGTEEKMFVEILLDKVVTNNKTNEERIISVKYNDTLTTNPDEIINIKHKLEEKKYEIKLEYDENKYVSQIIIEDI